MLINAYEYLRLFTDLRHAPEVSPRGQLCKELQDYMLEFNPMQPMLCSFEDRKINITYCKKEWQWYLYADPADSSIEKYATMWKKLKQADGTYYSNYGQYIFSTSYTDDDKSQFEFVIDELAKDPMSRRASIVLLQPQHLYHDNTDVVCTYGINFRIRESKLPFSDQTAVRLHMTVMMRSNDAIYGLTNDAFCFSELYKFVYTVLKHIYYPQLSPGLYRHFVNSIHIYEKHYHMLELILRGGTSKYEIIHTPMPTMDDVSDLIQFDAEYLAKTKPSPYKSWLIEE